jgi:uncharacterized HAD superfamily protein
MKKIGLDCDGVLYQFEKTAQYMIARKEGLKYREDLPWDNSTWDCHRPKEDWDWVLSEGADKVFRHGHLFRGAIEFVEELAELGDVSIITKRPKVGVQATLDFFSFEKLPISGFHILGFDEPKSSVPADIYIDDSADNIRELWKNTSKPLILIDRPWNQDLATMNIRTYRARDFDEAIAYVKEVL